MLAKRLPKPAKTATSHRRLASEAMPKRLCIGGPLDGQWVEVLDGQAFFHPPGNPELLYTRRRFMPVGGRGHVEAYAPKEMSDNEALELLAASYRAAGRTESLEPKPEKRGPRRRG